MDRDPHESDSSASGFFVLRTPLLPFETFEEWGAGLRSPSSLDGDDELLERSLAADRELLRARLRQLLTRPEIREAIFVGSPDLEERLPFWEAGSDPKHQAGVEGALVRYFVRMAARPTPFGLFSGCSTGRIGSETCLKLEDRRSHRRHTRLDMDYLSALTDALVGDRAVRSSLSFCPNSSLYRAAGRLRFAEGRQDSERGRTYNLIAVEPTDYLEATLRRAESGRRPAELAEALAADDPDVSIDEASEYVDELIDSQVLVADLDPPVTGIESVDGLVQQLDRFSEHRSVVSVLSSVQGQLRAIDNEGPQREAVPYRAVADSLAALPAKVELKRLFQVDLFKPAPEATLGPDVIDEIEKAIEILTRMGTPRRDDALQTFRQAFMRRYEGREVRLVEALDEETGVGFTPPGEIAAEATPLLEGLLLDSPGSEASTPWRRRESFLLEKLQEVWQQGSTGLELDESDLARLAAERPAVLPDAFEIMVSVAAGSEEALREGRFRVLVRRTSGPPGARMLGRFCHLDDCLRLAVESHLRGEEAHRPDAVFAEIVHLPQGRTGNILWRPVLRDHEIPYLGRSGVPRDRQIPVTDLLVSITGDRIVLRSERLGKEVIPRLTTAHNYVFRSLGLYRFLCSLQAQGVSEGVSWNWGALANARFLPRVVTGRLVLSRASWRVDWDEVQPLSKARGAPRYRSAAEWRARRGIPRLALVHHADNEMLIDFENPLCVDAFVHLTREQFSGRIVEMFPPADELCVRDTEGRYTQEIIVPFVRTPTATPKHRKVSSGPTVEVTRTFAPGSEWLYAKLYTGAATADRILCDVVRPLSERLIASGAAERWFFIRFGDPDRHLRVRFGGDPVRLREAAAPILQASFADLIDRGLAWRLQLDTYERETERYGGPLGITHAEAVFQADSDAVLEILSTFHGDEGLDRRWRLAVVGIDGLLDDLGFDLEANVEVLTRLRDSFGNEFRVGKAHRKRLAGKFREQRRSLTELLEGRGESAQTLSEGIAAIRRRSERVEGAMAELRKLASAGALTRSLPDLATSFAHMHVNRLLRGAHRAQELVIYDFLKLLYVSRAARRTKKPVS